MRAIEAGDEPRVQTLIASNAKLVTDRDSAALTPLHHAAVTTHTKV